MGITTAERRHPQFRSHGVGTCEWDGAVWPFATSQTLVALANVLRNYQQPYVSKADYFEALLTYARCHQYRGKPYIGEYLDEQNGTWLKPDSDRSRYYNHSTFCDLVISGLVGLVPREDNMVVVDPLIPAGRVGLVLPGQRVLSRPDADHPVGPNRREIPQGQRPAGLCRRRGNRAIG